MIDNELKELYKQTFNTVSAGYGRSAMRFFTESAELVPTYLQLNGDEHVIDVATGTGYAALAIAKHLPAGQVTAIDFSTGMLAQAVKNTNEQGLHNITFSEMDMQSLDFEDGFFDAAVSTFGIFFIEDMQQQLIHIANKVKVGGTLLITTFFENAFAPLVDLFLTRLQSYGVEVPSLAWKRVATPEQCLTLFKEAGLRGIQSDRRQCGYYLKDADEWWDILWNGGFRGLLNQLSKADFTRFKSDHVSEVQELASENGIWMEMSVLYTHGKKLGASG